MTVRALLLNICLVLILSAACLPSLAQSRDPGWAVPAPSSHVDNLYKVDEGIYRCGQPSKEAFRELYSMGVREILNLRNHHSDIREARGSGLVLHRIRMNAGDSETAKYIEALRIIRDRRGPIAIHCWHGSDRTGIVVALYRMAFQGWPREKALDEFVNGGYGYHSYYRNLKTYIMEADVDAIRTALGNAGANRAYQADN